MELYKTKRFRRKSKTDKNDVFEFAMLNFDISFEKFFFNIALLPSLYIYRDGFKWCIVFRFLILSISMNFYKEDILPF